MQCCFSCVPTGLKAKLVLAVPGLAKTNTQASLEASRLSVRILHCTQPQQVCCIFHNTIMQRLNLWSPKEKVSDSGSDVSVCGASTVPIQSITNENLLYLIAILEHVQLYQMKVSTKYNSDFPYGG